jgi:hypothetical protein
LEYLTLAAFAVGATKIENIINNKVATDTALTRAYFTCITPPKNSNCISKEGYFDAMMNMHQIQEARGTVAKLKSSKPIQAEDASKKA